MLYIKWIVNVWFGKNKPTVIIGITLISYIIGILSLACEWKSGSVTSDY